MAQELTSLFTAVLIFLPWMNSYSTHLKAGAGGFKGRTLQKDDEILFVRRLIFLPY